MIDTILKGYRGDRGPVVDGIVQWVEDLPPMPTVAMKALRKLESDHSTAQDLAEILDHDPAITTQILRAANSAAASRQRKVKSLAEGVQVVGFRAIKPLIVATLVKGYRKNFGPIEQLVWNRAVGTAITARIFAQLLGTADADEAYLAGLLHNLGQMVLLSQPEFGLKYENVFEEIEKNGEDFVTVEHRLLGFSNSLVGALVARKWELSPELCNSILFAQVPFEGIDSDQDAAVARLRFAILLNEMAQLAPVPNYPLNTAELHTIAASLGIDRQEETLANMAHMAKTQFQTELSLYRG